ncbi:family 43 glycosylhydrolase [Arcticibacterium luteifluviistationis]|uniref:Xylosidase n=1 Tax=Arcticibacterium luteifluviistationis TaxID=1784714 RepID=A0A2Z4G990_9BACT|nr:family 43 glycosylhydrolase [Arcticibacterium luteifluviistationis]AWV97640.1 xylosidase [Arcticibacterium luteifluviistationis]
MKVIKLLFVLMGIVCTSESANAQDGERGTVKANGRNLKFKYSEIIGIGSDSLYNRRDNSDIIKVGDTYYIWYTRMDSPVTSGYWGTIWYATSSDEGFTWKEQGMALGLGEQGAFDSHSVFTPNILVQNGKYYLYYTAVKPTEGNVNNEFEGNSMNDFTAIGLAVSDSPNGPFVRVEHNPVLTVSDVTKDFDSYRVDDASLLVREDKVWLYYKGRSMSHGKNGPKLTQMGVAFADRPEGPFVKNREPILDKSHEVLIWTENEGVASLASFSQSVYLAADGLNFSPLYQDLVNIPKAPGLYRPSLINSSERDTENWGIAMVQKNKKTYLLRFEMKQD